MGMNLEAFDSTGKNTGRNTGERNLAIPHEIIYVCTPKPHNPALSYILLFNKPRMLMASPSVGMINRRNPHWERINKNEADAHKELLCST